MYPTVFHQPMGKDSDIKWSSTPCFAGSNILPKPKSPHPKCHLEHLSVFFGVGTLLVDFLEKTIERKTNKLVLGPGPTLGAKVSPGAAAESDLLVGQVL